MTFNTPDPVEGVRKIGQGFQEKASEDDSKLAKSPQELLDKPDTKGKLS